jgi:hypothetical protein
MVAHYSRGNALPNTLIIKAPAGLSNATDLARLDALDVELAWRGHLAGRTCYTKRLFSSECERKTL